MKRLAISTCAAVVPASTYRGEGRCERRFGLVKVNGRLLCKPHAEMVKDGRAVAYAQDEPNFAAKFHLRLRPA